MSEKFKLFFLGMGLFITFALGYHVYEQAVRLGEEIEERYNDEYLKIN